MEEAISYTQGLIADKLKKNSKVLLLLSGGSSAFFSFGLLSSLKSLDLKNLIVSLVDERYGPPLHKNSNWLLFKKFVETFNIENYPVLLGKDIKETALVFNHKIQTLLKEVDYRIGVFGIGADGHTAGILPNSEAVSEESFVVQYFTEEYNRITITPKAILKLDEAILIVKGDEKDQILEKLQNTDTDISTMPAQILKKINKLKIFKI